MLNQTIAPSAIVLCFYHLCFLQLFERKLYYQSLKDFQNFPEPEIFLQDFQLLGNPTIKFQNFPGFPGPTQTLFILVSEERGSESKLKASVEKGRKVFYSKFNFVRNAPNFACSFD